MDRHYESTLTACWNRDRNILRTYWCACRLIGNPSPRMIAIHAQKLRHPALVNNKKTMTNIVSDGALVSKGPVEIDSGYRTASEITVSPFSDPVRSERAIPFSFRTTNSHSALIRLSLEKIFRSRHKTRSQSNRSIFEPLCEPIFQTNHSAANVGAVK